MLYEVITVEQTIDKLAESTGIGHPVSKGVNTLLEQRPDKTTHIGHRQAYQPGHDRHQPLATEKRQVFRQSGVVKT